MKKTVINLLILLVLILTSNVFASVLLTDDFTGDVGANLTTVGWTLHSGTGTPFTITSPGLTYSGYTGSNIGNAATTGGTSDDINKAFSSTNSGSLYYAFLYKPTAASTTSDYGVSFGNAAGASVSGLFGRLHVQRDASNNLRFGIARQTGTVAYTNYVYSLSTTYLIIIKYEFVSGTANDVVSLFVNPTLGGTEPTATVINTVDTSGDATQLISVILRQSANTAGAVIDGIRVGTAWADVAGASMATEPTAQPTNLQFSNVTSTSFDVAFTAASPTAAGYLAIRKSGSAPTTDPTDGTA